MSSTVRQGKSTGDWKTTPMSWRGPVIGVPRSRASPREGGMRPARILRSVVFPAGRADDGDEVASATSKLMPSSAATLPSRVA